MSHAYTDFGLTRFNNRVIKCPKHLCDWGSHRCRRIRRPPARTNSSSDHFVIRLFGFMKAFGTDASVPSKRGYMLCFFLHFFAVISCSDCSDWASLSSVQEPREPRETLTLIGTADSIEEDPGRLLFWFCVLTETLLRFLFLNGAMSKGTFLLLPALGFPLFLRFLFPGGAMSRVIFLLAVLGVFDAFIG